MGVTFYNFDWRWPHPATVYDISWDAVMGTRQQFEDWATPFRAMMAKKVAVVGIGAASPIVTGPVVDKGTYLLKAYAVPFPKGPTFNLFVAVPKSIDQAKPLIVGLSGHEAQIGEAPNVIFANGGWGDKWAKAGYAVYAPANMFYYQLGVFSDGRLGVYNDYHAVNVRAQQRLWERVSPILPAYTGRVITGLSAGCETGAWWSAIEPDMFDIATFSGHMVDLDWLRENYRLRSPLPFAIGGEYPKSWSINGILSFTSLFALLSPKPLQMQLGRLDGFFPRLNKAPANAAFPGEPRPPIVDDVMALHASLKQIWQTAGGVYELDIHEGGHEVDFTAAKAFVEAN